MNSSYRRIIQNTALNLIASVSQRIGYAIILIAVARLLTKAEVGSFTLANTYSSILLAFSLWGLDQLLIREVSRDAGLLSHYLYGYLALRLVLATLLWAGLYLIMPLFAYTPDTNRLILIMSLTMIPANVINLYQSVWIAFEEVMAISLITLIFSLFRVLGGLGLLLTHRSLQVIAYLLLVVSVTEMIINVWMTQRRPDVISFQLRIKPRFWIENLKTATPLIVVTLLLIIEYQFDVIILSIFRPEQEVGVYGTAVTILTFLLFFTRSYQLAVFPVISRAFHTNLAHLRQVYVKSITYLVIGALIVATIVAFFSRQVIQLIYAAGYESAAVILSVLVWGLVISAFNVPNSRLLLVANQQRLMALFAVFSMSGNVLLSLWLVPRLGGLGSAWARVLAMPLYTIPAFYYVQRHICRVAWREWLQLMTWKRAV